MRRAPRSRFSARFWTAPPAGFCYLQETGKDTAEVAAMGVRRAFHRQGIGRALLQRAKAAARAKGYSFLQVKTVQMGRYAAYDRTNRFYLAMGVRRAFHRQGIGRALLQRAKAAARAKGYSFLQVKTVQMGRYAA